MTGIKKFRFEKKYLIPALYILFVLCAAIAFEKAVGNIPELWQNLQRAAATVFNILTPFVYGVFIAYFLNPAMCWLETNLFGRIPWLQLRQRLKRILAVVTTYIILIGGILWIVAYLLPEVMYSVQNLIVSAMENARVLEQLWDEYFSDSETIESVLETFNNAVSTNYEVADLVDMALQPLLSMIASMPDLINTVVGRTINAAYSILNFVLGMIIGFYMLCDKEKFAERTTRFLHTILPGRYVERIIRIGHISNDTFKNFFMGKAVDSTIIGLLFFVVSMMMGLSYPVLLSLIIGVTNMIPYFGPFIGAVPVLLIVLLTNYRMVLWTGLVIFILQQFDGTILGPKILGDSTGLSPLGVMFSIIIGGAVGGVLGMFLGVPVFAVITNLFSAMIDRRYEKRTVGMERSDGNE